MPICPHKKHTAAIGAFAAYFCALLGAPDIGLFDFEGTDPLKGWTNEDEAFDVVGKDTNYYGRIRVQNVEGEQFLYSFDPMRRNNHPVGRLISPEFKIQRDYINFIFGGGRGWPERLGVQLVVDGKVVRSSTGRESRPGISFKMLPLNWDVKAFKGKTARLVFNDQTPYGSIGADHFVQSDTPRGFRSDATERFKEMYRPAYHATAGRGWLNDPNGMFYYNGKWFLGFQHNYVDACGTGWGLTVSDDLIHWTVSGETVPVGVTGQAFSGGAAIDWNNTSGLKKGAHPPILLCYTLLPPGNGGYPDTPLSKTPKAQDLRFYPALAYSTDGGQTWTKDTTPLFQYDNPEMLTYEKGRKYTLDGGQTWVDDPSILLGAGGFRNDRDGKIIWYEPTKEWIMIWHLSQNNYRPNTAFGLYRSKDLKKWELFQTIPGMWECPDFFEIEAVDTKGNPTGKKYWIMPRGGVEYFVGTFDGKEFKPISANDPKNPYEQLSFDDPNFKRERFLRRVNFKSGCYAAQTFADAPNGRKVQVSWLSEGKLADNMPGSPFEGVLSFPVELTLRDTGKGLILEHVPVKEIEKIYKKTHSLKDIRLNEGTTINPLKVGTQLLDIDVTFEAADAEKFGVIVSGERIVYDVKTQKLWAFRDFDPKKQVFVEKSTWVPLQDGKIQLRILVDRSSIEVGINNGIYRTTMLVYPQTDAPQLDFVSEGGQARILDLRVSELDAEQASSNTPDRYREEPAPPLP